LQRPQKFGLQEHWQLPDLIQKDRPIVSKMPGLDGPHFYRALQESGSPLAARFLFVTGDVLGRSTQEFLREHALPHVAKPFRMEEFMQAMAMVLGAARDASNLAPVRRPVSA
jgi:CheY-like chemotaxis protein